MNRCVECGEPARLARGAEDVYTEHCSNECAIATWNRANALGAVTVCTGLTMETLEEQLETTGLTVEEQK